jgi:hypothetical protein
MGLSSCMRLANYAPVLLMALFLMAVIGHGAYFGHLVRHPRVASMVVIGALVVMSLVGKIAWGRKR